MSNISEPDCDSKTSTTHRQQTLAGAVLILTMLTAYNGVIPVLATRICKYFSLSTEQYGTLIGMSSLLQIPALLSAGFLIARFGVRRTAECSIIGIGTCFVAIGLGANLTSLRCSIPAHGFFAALSKVAVPALLITLYPMLKRRMLSVQLVVYSTMGIAIPLWANQLLQWSAEGDDLVFSQVFFRPFLAVGCIIVVGGVLLSLRSQPFLQIQHPKQETFHVRALFRWLLEVDHWRSDRGASRSIVIILLMALHVVADSTIYQYLPMFMDHQFGETRLGAWALSGHAIAYVTTRSLLSLLPEGVGQRKILILAGPIGGLLIMAMLWQGHANFVPLIYTLASLAFAAEFPVLVSEISSRSMKHFGTILAIGHLVSSLAIFVLLKGTGRLVDATGDYRIPLSIAACGFIAFGVIVATTDLGKAIRPQKTMQS